MVVPPPAVLEHGEVGGKKTVVCHTAKDFSVGFTVQTIGLGDRSYM